MQLRRFQAATMAEAYARVRDALGDDAMIVATRSAAAPALLGSGKRDFVEVVAGAADGGDGGDAPPAAEATIDGEGAALDAGAGGDDTADQNLAPPFENALAGSALAAPADGPFDLFDRAPANAADAADAPEAASEAPAGSPPAATLMGAIASDVAEVREMLVRISAQRVSERIDQGPAALQQARSRLVEQDVGAAPATAVLDQLADAAVDGATQAMVLQTLQRKLAAQLPPVVTLDLGRAPLAIFVVGPGGAGRTSLAVRLGLELATARGARVTLAGVDVNRAGAPQQLTAYGAATGLPVRLCYSPGELKALLDEGSADVAIVDTPANNGTRRDRMAELKAFTQVAAQRTTLLTVPAVAKTADVLRTTAAFAEAGIDGLVLTRCDETETYGGLYTAAYQHRTGIAYSTHGEGVDEPIHAGDNHALALAIVTGRWPRRADVGPPALTA